MRLLLCGIVLLVACSSSPKTTPAQPPDTAVVDTAKHDCDTEQEHGKQYKGKHDGHDCHEDGDRDR